jgi:hypothetical protein
VADGQRAKRANGEGAIWREGRHYAGRITDMGRKPCPETGWAIPTSASADGRPVPSGCSEPSEVRR